MTKKGCSIDSATKDHIHAVLGIDFLVYGEQIFGSYPTTI